MNLVNGRGWPYVSGCVLLLALSLAVSMPVVAQSTTQLSEQTGTNTSELRQLSPETIKSLLKSLNLLKVQLLEQKKQAENLQTDLMLSQQELIATQTQLADLQKELDRISQSLTTALEASAKAQQSLKAEQEAEAKIEAELTAELARAKHKSDVFKYTTIGLATVSVAAIIYAAVK